MNKPDIERESGAAMLEWVRCVLLAADEAELRAHLRAVPPALLPDGRLEYIPANGASPSAIADASPAPVAVPVSVPVHVDGREVGRLVLHDAPATAASDEALERVRGLFEAVLATQHRQAAGSDADGDRHEAFFEQLFAAAPEAIAVLDTGDRIVRTNRTFQELFGYTPGELTGRTINEMIVPAELRADALALTNRVASGGYVREDTIRVRKDGSRVHVSILATPIIIDGDQVAVYGMYRDITAQKEAEEALRRLSTTDDLTGLFNRRGFFLLAEQQRRVAIRRKSDLMLLYIDIDDFKHVNDTYGHVAGDRVLAELGVLLHNCYRESDIIARMGEGGGLLARMGGDEFVVLAIDPGEEGEKILTDRLRQRLAEYNRSGTPPCEISLSIGAVRVPPDPQSTLDTMVAAADRLMYADKRQPPSA
jgi:diguanylate cyclase (GGDEF)-like protein/PAS domain S-box-containing protein